MIVMCFVLMNTHQKVKRLAETTSAASTLGSAEVESITRRVVGPHQTQLFDRQQAMMTTMRKLEMSIDELRASTTTTAVPPSPPRPTTAPPPLLVSADDRVVFPVAADMEAARGEEEDHSSFPAVAQVETKTGSGGVVTVAMAPPDIFDDPSGAVALPPPTTAAVGAAST